MCWSLFRQLHHGAGHRLFLGHELAQQFYGQREHDGGVSLSSDLGESLEVPGGKWGSKV